MIKNRNEKSLIKVNDNSIFYRIRKFLKNFFSKEKSIIIETNNDTIKTNENKRSDFIEDIRKIENQETATLDLQRKYRNKEIKEEDLTEEQITSLCELYDKQISDLKKSNERKKQELLKYKKVKSIDTV